MNTENTDPRYPIGRYQPQAFSAAQCDTWLNDLRMLPDILEDAVKGFGEAQYNHLYRPGGWTIRQLVHHIADSHLNAYLRFKLALTEDMPVIKPYKQNLWAGLRDSEVVEPPVSLTLIRALHIRWYEAVAELTEAEWDKKMFHPEQQKELSLWYMLGLYAWHGHHHVAHITHATFD